MKKILLSILMIFIVSTSFAQVAGTTIKGQKSDGSFEFIKTNDAGKMSVDAAVSMDTSVTLKVQSDQNTGAKDAAGGPFSITTGKTIVNFPAGTQGFLCNAFGGDIIMNHANRLATGTFYVGVRIASGTAMPWTGLASGSTPSIAFSSNSGSNATATFVWW